MDPIIQYDLSQIQTDIQLYVSGLKPQQPTNTSSEYAYNWPGLNNPIPEFDTNNTDIRISGYLEDYRPLYEQLGPGGQLWNIDYETHLEQGTLAVLLPIVRLAERVSAKLIAANEELINLRSELNNVKQGYLLSVIKRQWDSDITVVYPPDFPDSFNYFPRLIFYSESEIGKYMVNNNILQYFRISEETQGSRTVYVFRPKELSSVEQGISFEGKLIVS